MKPPPPNRPAGTFSRLRRKGSALIEAAVTIGLLGLMATLLMRSSINALSGRYWTMSQVLTDAYLTYEVALAQREPFDKVVAPDSKWPIYPSKSIMQVEIGTLPGGPPMTGWLHRTRIANTGNLPAAGGTGSETTNPTRMESWKLEAHLVYTVGNTDYVKSRTVLRTR